MLPKHYYARSATVKFGGECSVATFQLHLLMSLTCFEQRQTNLLGVVERSSLNIIFFYFCIKQALSKYAYIIKDYGVTKPIN